MRTKSASSCFPESLGGERNGSGRYLYHRGQNERRSGKSKYFFRLSRSIISRTADSEGLALGDLLCCSSRNRLLQGGGDCLPLYRWVCLDAKGRDVLGLVCGGERKRRETPSTKVTLKRFG